MLTLITSMLTSTTTRRKKEFSSILAKSYLQNIKKITNKLTVEIIAPLTKIYFLPHLLKTYRQAIAPTSPITLIKAGNTVYRLGKVFNVI